jgi:outer membrane protein assembly factor BamD
VAAINRAQSVLQDYKDVPAAEEALKILIDCYDALGLTQQRDDTRRVLNASFPAQEAGPVKKPWWKKW